MGFENWGDYFWPGQIDECRRNLLGIHDPVQLEAAERKHTFARQLQLIKGEVRVEQTFDLEHLRGIHRHLFQDVYEWAGELRVTELVRPSDDPNLPGHEFVKPEGIVPLSGLVFERLDPVALRDAGRGEQLEVLASTYAGLNVLHPFVEGNGRTQRLFLDDVAAAGGLQIDWSKMPDQNAVMAEAFTVGYQPVVTALEPCVTIAPEVDDQQRINRIRSAMSPAPGTPGRPRGGSPEARRAPELGKSLRGRDEGLGR